MEEAMAAGSALTTMERPVTTGMQLPLSFLKKGQSARVVKVRGKGDLHHHLETLGFVEGAQVSVACENNGNLIVEVKGSQIALNKQVATKIITC